MTAQAQQFAAQPEILRIYRGFDDETRHKVLQLLLREFAYAEDEADLFLAAAATELYPVGEDDGGHYWSEGAADLARDDLYPGGMMNAEASRHHRMMLERDVVAAERRVNGRAAMMIGKVSLSGADFHGEGRFGG